MTTRWQQFCKTWIWNDFARGGLLLTAVSALGQILTVVFRMLAGRRLDSPAYGTLDAMLALTGLLSLPFMAIQLAVAHAVAARLGAGRPQDAGRLLWRAQRRLALYAGAVWLVLLPAGPWLARLLKVPDAWPVWVSGLVLLTGAMAIIFLGGLQGAQRFVALGLAGGAGALLRVLALVLFLGLGWGAAGALGAGAAANLGVLLLGAWWLRGLLAARHGSTAGGGEVYRFMGPALLAGAIQALLMNADMLVAKRVFDPVLAGDYARVTVIGRLVVHLCGALLLVLFPKVVAETAAGGRGLGLLARALAWGGALGVAAALGCTLWPTLPIRILHGPAHLGLAPLVRVAVWAFLPLSLVHFMIQFFMGRRRFGFLPWLALGGVALVALTLCWHATPLRLLVAVGAGGWICVLLAAARLAWEERCPRS